jgi:hypothetical protein
MAQGQSRVSGPTRALPEAELTSEEVERILKVCGPHALLVGGQALATWAVYYGIQPAGELSRVVTMDAGFIGSNETAQKLQRSLGQPWKLRKATLDDFGPQVAKVYATLPEQGIKQVDFLSGIVGLDTDAIRRRASLLTLEDGTTVQLLHPLDVLESRLRNLDALPSKRNATGVAQARLAVSVVRAFIEHYMNEAGDPRIVRQAVKRVEKLALDNRLLRVAFTYDIDVLAAIPADRIAYSRFREEQWPRILARLNTKRAAFERRKSRDEANEKTRHGAKRPGSPKPKTKR